MDKTVENAALNFTAGKNFKAKISMRTAKSTKLTKIFTLENFRLYNSILIINLKGKEMSYRVHWR